MTRVELHADQANGHALVGTPAGPAGLAVLELDGVVLAVDAARPGRVVELTIERDAGGAPALDASSATGATRTVSAERLGHLGRLALALDEWQRPDDLGAPVWALDIVAEATAAGLVDIAARHAAGAAAVLLGTSAASASAPIVEDARVVRGYVAPEAVTVIDQWIARAEGTAASHTGSSDVVARNTTSAGRAFVERAVGGRVAGAAALDVDDLYARLSVSRQARLVWHRDNAELTVTIDAVGVPAPAWVRVLVEDVLAAVAPVVWDRAGAPVDGPDTHAETAALGVMTGVASMQFSTSNDLGSARVELVAEVGSPVTSLVARGRQRAIAAGRQGARAARLGGWASGRDAWLVSAACWALAGDGPRQALALGEAAACFENQRASADAEQTRSRAAGIDRGWALALVEDGAGPPDPAFLADLLSVRSR